MRKKDQKRMIGIGMIFLVLLLILTSFQSDFFLKSRVFKYVALRGSELASVISGVLVMNTNDYRTNNNENTLIVNSTLTLAAQMKAEDMARRSYFSHIGPDGEKPWYWFKKNGYKYEYAGENLAIDFTESNDVSQAWINSAKHKANLLNPNFTEIGVGVADGIYEGRNTTFVVQFFGKPYIEKKEEAQVKNLPIATNVEIPSDPAIGIVTRIDTPSGVVLGTEDVSYQIKINWFWVIGTLVLVLFIGYGVRTSIKK